MLFQHKNYIKRNKYLACLLITAMMIISMPYAVSAAVAASLTASPHLQDSDTRVILEWSSVAGARMYRILRDDGSGFNPIGTVDPELELEATAYTDEGLSPETLYSYRLKAYRNAEMTDEIPLSFNQASIRTTEMIQPSGLSAVYNINTRMVSLSWDTASRAAMGCIVKIGNDSGATVASSVYNSAKTITFITNETAPVNYVVITNDGTGGHTSAASAPIRIIPVVPPAVTAAPAPGGSATVTWGAFPQITDFQLQRSKWSGTGWSAWEVANTSPTGTGAVDSPSAGGTYRYRLSARDSGPYAGHSNVTGNVICPKAPVNPSCTIVNGSRIDLAWTNAAGNESVLRVARKQPDGSYLLLAALNKGAASYSDAVSIQMGRTYTYRITAWESEDNYSSSVEFSITASIPEAPSNLTLTANSKTSATLNWQDNSASEQSFIIERKTGTGSFAAIATSAANSTSYTDNTVDEGKTYTYRVQAFNSLGVSAYSNTISITVDNIVVPNALTVTAVSSDRIDLAWSYPGNGSYTTVIERKTGVDGVWSVIAITPPGTYMYGNTGLAANTRYFYRIRNSLGSGITTPSYPNNDSGIGADTMLNGLNLTGEAVSGGRILLEWWGASGGSETVIERKMANGGFAVLATVNTSLNGWYDTTGLIPGASYTYRVKAQNSMNKSTYSNELTIENIYLEVPSEFTAAPDSNQTLTLRWKDNSDGEMGFEIWRRVHNSGSYVLLDKVGPNVTAYTDKSAQPGVQYYYRIRAYLGQLYSSYTVSQSAGAGIINPPDDLRFTYVSDTSITLAWDDNSNDESGFKIEKKTGADDQWIEIATVSSNTKTYKYTGLSPYVKYFFRVRAYKAYSSMDSFSNEIEITTGKPPAPSDVSAGSVSSYQARIKWKDNSDNEMGFKILKAVVGATNYSVEANVGKDVTSYVDSGLGGDTRYSYKVVAYNESGESESMPVEVVTGSYITFRDVSAGFWAREAIINLAGRGIIKGKTENLFGPGETISRAEFTAMMIRAFNLDTAPVGSFADVKLGKWYYNEVMIAENLGIIHGDAENKFYPEKMITREDMSVIIVKTLGVAGKPLNSHGNNVLEKFWDRDMISPYALSGIATIVGEGIMTGLPGNAIAPKKTLTRAEAAAMIYRVIDR